MKIGRIVSYGCSFTAGQELGDAEILQIDVDVLDKRKVIAGVGNPDAIYQTREMQKKCDDHSLTFSWPTHLAKKIDVSCWNRAYLGTSLADAAFRLTHDIERGLIRDNDLIIVGVTCPTRFSFLSRGDNHMITKMLAVRKHWPSKEVYEFMVAKWGTNNNIIWEHAKHLKYLDLLSDSFGGRIKMVTTVYSWYNMLQHSFPPGISWLSNMRFKHLLGRDVSFSDTYGDTPYKQATHGWGHPKAEYHIKFADLVYNKLKDGNIIQ
jgi:hypothetical protein